MISKVPTITKTVLYYEQVGLWYLHSRGSTVKTTWRYHITVNQRPARVPQMLAKSQPNVAANQLKLHKVCQPGFTIQWRVNAEFGHWHKKLSWKCVDDVATTWKNCLVSRVPCWHRSCWSNSDFYYLQWQKLTRLFHLKLFSLPWILNSWWSLRQHRCFLSMLKPNAI